MTSGLETERAYSGFGASQICHLVTYLLRHLPTYLQPRDPHGVKGIPKKRPVKNRKHL